jgi:hypothetical protein
MTSKDDFIASAISLTSEMKNVTIRTPAKSSITEGSKFGYVFSKSLLPKLS